MIKLILFVLILSLVPSKVISCDSQDIPISSFLESMRPFAKTKSLSGDDLKIVRDFLSIESEGVPLVYDKLIFVIKSGKDKVMVMTVVKECVTNGAVIPLEDYKQILSEIEGI